METTANESRTALHSRAGDMRPAVNDATRQLGTALLVTSVWICSKLVVGWVLGQKIADEVPYSQLKPKLDCL